MKKFWKKNSSIVYNIDRIESHLGNIMIRGWAASRDADSDLKISVQDGDGNVLNVYVERLVRGDVNQMFGVAEDYESGMHILIDRAVLNTPYVWLIFDNGKESQREKVRINAGSALERKIRARKNAESDEPDYDLWIRSQEPDAKERR